MRYFGCLNRILRMNVWKFKPHWVWNNSIGAQNTQIVSLLWGGAAPNNGVSRVYVTPNWLLPYVVPLCINDLLFNFRLLHNALERTKITFIIVGSGVLVRSQNGSIGCLVLHANLSCLNLPDMLCFDTLTQFHIHRAFLSRRNKSASLIISINFVEINYSHFRSTFYIFLTPLQKLLLLRFAPLSTWSIMCSFYFIHFAKVFASFRWHFLN